MRRKVYIVRRGARRSGKIHSLMKRRSSAFNIIMLAFATDKGSPAFILGPILIIELYLYEK